MAVERGKNVDARGNRIKAQELVVPSGATPSNITYLCTDNKVAYRGTWGGVVSGFKPTSDPSASLKLALYCTGITFTYGRGPDHGIFDVYIGGSLYASYDGYNGSNDEVGVNVDFGGMKAYTFEIRNRRVQNALSSGNVVRFKKVEATNVLTADLHTIRYDYDGLARLRSADYAYNDSPAASPFRQYAYSFDVAGNRTQQVVTVSGSPTTTDYEYNAGNQLYRQRVNGGAWTNLTYNDNGSLTNDGTNSYTWDRANRLLSMGGSSYAYDGVGNRHKQTIAGNATNYLLDLQPGLTVVLAQITGANTDRFIHAVEGIHAQKDASNNWEWMMQDGLGSVRGVVSSGLSILETRVKDPFGNAISSTGSSQTPFDFTGEMSDPNELLFLRARYYRPSIGTFTALDPFEGIEDEPMSLNGYGYVHGNPTNWTDPSGEIIDPIAAILLVLAALFIQGALHAWMTFLLELMIGRYRDCLAPQIPPNPPTEDALPLPDAPGYYPPPSIVPPRKPTIIDALIVIFMILILVLTFPYPNPKKGKDNEDESTPFVMIAGPGSNADEVYNIYLARRSQYNVIAVEPYSDHFVPLRRRISNRIPLEKLSESKYQSSDGSLTLILADHTQQTINEIGSNRQASEMFINYPTIGTLASVLPPTIRYHLQTGGTLYTVTEELGSTSTDNIDDIMKNICTARGGSLIQCGSHRHRTREQMAKGENFVQISMPSPYSNLSNRELQGVRV